MKNNRKLLMFGVLAAAFGVGGCRTEDKGRPLSFEPGVYRGEKVSPLSADEQKALQQRGNLQR